MGAIRVERSADGERQDFTVDTPAELRSLLASWASIWDWQTTVTSRVFDDAAIVAALPEHVETVGSAEVDELHDALSDQLELPSMHDAQLLGCATVNGHRWVLLDRGPYCGKGWVPVPFWEYPLETVYELGTHTVGGAMRLFHVYRAAGVTISLMTWDHFGARAGSDEQVSVEPEPFEIEFEDVVDDPEGRTSPDDPLDEITLTVPTLTPEQSEALAQHLATKHGPYATVTVNQATVEAAEEAEGKRW